MKQSEHLSLPSSLSLLINLASVEPWDAQFRKQNTLLGGISQDRVGRVLYVMIKEY